MEENELRKVRQKYQSKQAREKRYMEVQEKLQKPGVLLKLCIVLGFGLAFGLASIYEIILGK